MHCNEGLNELMDIIVNELTFETLIILQDNVTIIAADRVFGDLSEPVFTGYAGFSSTDLAWPAAASGGGDETFVNGPLCEFECTAEYTGADILGIAFLIRRTGGAWKLFFLENFEEPETIAIAGDKVQKKLNFRSRNY